MKQDLICKCGNAYFHVSSNRKIVMCGKCHATYDEYGNEVKLSDIKDKGEVVYFTELNPIDKEVK